MNSRVPRPEPHFQQCHITVGIATRSPNTGHGASSASARAQDSTAWLIFQSRAADTLSLMDVRHEPAQPVSRRVTAPYAWAALGLLTVPQGGMHQLDEQAGGR